MRMLTRLKQGIATFGRYAFASVLSTCQYVSSAGNLLVNLEGKLVNFAGSTNTIVNEVITGVSTVASLLVTSFTRVPANFRLILTKSKVIKPLSQKIEDNPDLAKEGKLYLKADGSYIARYRGRVNMGYLQDESGTLLVDMSTFPKNLSDANFVNSVLDITSAIGHTAAGKKPVSFKSLGWKGRIFYLLNAPLSVLSCFFGPLNIYYFSHTVVMGLIYLLRKVMPAPSDQPDDEEKIMHMGGVITISVFILLARAINTVAYDLKIANANTLEIASAIDKGELPTNWSLLLATAVITLPSAPSVTMLAHNSTLKSLTHIADQLPFHIPFPVINAVTKFSTISATQGHILKSAPSIYNMILRTLNRIEGNPPQETTSIGCSLMLKTLFYGTCILTCLTDGFTGAASVANLFQHPKSALALTAAIVSGASLSACAFGLNRQGFFRTMNYQPVVADNDLEANQGLLANDELNDEVRIRPSSANDFRRPPRTQAMPINHLFDKQDDMQDDMDDAHLLNASPMTPILSRTY